MPFYSWFYKSEKPKMERQKSGPFNFGLRLVSCALAEKMQ